MHDRRNFLALERRSGQTERVSLLLHGFRSEHLRFLQGVVGKGNVGEFSLEQGTVIPGIAQAGALLVSVFEKLQAIFDFLARASLDLLKRLHHVIFADATAFLIFAGERAGEKQHQKEYWEESASTHRLGEAFASNGTRISCGTHEN